MSARRFPTAELYEERSRDFYRNGNRSERSYEELDLDIGRRDARPGRQPDFLREDYGRTSAGALVVRGDRPPSDDFARAPPRRSEVEKDELVIRDRRPERPRERDPRDREVDREEIIFRRGEREPERPRPRDDITFRRGEIERIPRPGPRDGEREREEIRFKEIDRPSRGRDVEREEIIYRRDERSQSRPRERSMDPIVHRPRPRERSLPPPRLVAREREDFVIRRRSPSPQQRDDRKEEIIIRRTEHKSPSPAPSPPPPPPQQEPIVRPPIVQEIITHHRHIDHGVERARSPTPPPPPPSPPRDDTLEIAIRRSNSRAGKYVDEDIIYERDLRERRDRDYEREMTRRRSLSAPRRRRDDDLEEEADYYNRKAMERAYIGEAYNGATKDWTIVDVPPGTNRVRMDGVGGGSQEITWQRYNGVRRSKFITDDEEFGSDFGRPAPVKPRTADMWTEITKDLVIKEAIESFGYDYEETEYFFYVMEYLRYEDVLRLVELSDDIRRERRQRIREIQYERDEISRDRRPKYDDRIYEREVIFDSRRDRYR